MVIYMFLIQPMNQDQTDASSDSMLLMSILPNTAEIFSHYPQPAVYMLNWISILMLLPVRTHRKHPAPSLLIRKTGFYCLPIATVINNSAGLLFTAATMPI